MRSAFSRASRQRRCRWPAPGPPPGRGAATAGVAATQQGGALPSQLQQPYRLKLPDFNLPSELKSPGTPVGRYALPTPPADEEERPTIRLDKITSEDVATQWPPAGLIVQASPPAEVRRPNLWVQDDATVGPEDVGRFVRVDRNALLEHLPEGGCGELARDLTLIPSRDRAVGLMLRKLTVELIMQLQELRDATDSRGAPRIRKAGFLIDGKKGAGKSQVLNLLTMWARRSGWLVVMEPVPSRYSKEIADIKRSNNGVYIQSEFAKQFLEATSIANREMLLEIPVDLSVYGSRAIDGESARETRRLYEPLIDKTVEQEAAGQGLTGPQRLERIAAYRRQVRVPSMADQLTKPVNVWEIVEFGLQNDAYAAQAVSELFVQLQRQVTHPVLVVVDEWNECFPVSEYVSIRYDNTRFNGFIPAYHLTMPRAFRRWDGHLYRRGLKIYATSWMRFRRREYRPDLLGVKEHEIREVRNFSQHEFANYVMYLRLMNVLHNFPREDLEYYYMMTQGNGYQARKLLATLY